jgi:uncharacterized protein YjlB
VETGVTRWSGSAAPTEQALRLLLESEGLQPYSWANGPFDRYAPHSHDYDKVIYVVRGAITFGLPQVGKSLALTGGDRLDLPSGTVHDAIVGAEGVVCLEAHSE